MKHVLQADGIQISYGTRRILSDVYLQCETGKITGLLGRNGSGKSTLLQIVFGSKKDCERSVRLNSLLIPVPYLEKKFISYLPQHNFIPSSLPLQKIFANYSVDFSEFESRLPFFKNKNTARIANFSGGERRLIEAYLIISMDTKFSLLDEPFTQLSPLQVNDLQAIIKDKLPHKGFVITDHLYSHVLELSDQLYILSAGYLKRIRNEGEITELGYLPSRS